jgi:hypothetical protein
VRHDVGMRNRSGAECRDARALRELFDAMALGAVADEQEDRVLDVDERVDCELEGVESSEAADPSDHEPFGQPEARAFGLPIGP